MNGPEHYREAERLVARSELRPEGELDLASADAAAAMVHATLAQADAMVELERTLRRFAERGPRDVGHAVSAALGAGARRVGR